MFDLRTRSNASRNDNITYTPDRAYEKQRSRRTIRRRLPTTTTFSHGFAATADGRDGSRENANGMCVAVAAALATRDNNNAQVTMIVIIMIRRFSYTARKDASSLYPTHAVRTLLRSSAGSRRRAGPQTVRAGIANPVGNDNIQQHSYDANLDADWTRARACVPTTTFNLNTIRINATCDDDDTT